MEKITTLFEQAVKSQWQGAALSEFNVRTISYEQLANNIVRMHLVWKAIGLQEGDKIALNARNSIHWAEVFFAALTGGYVSVQLYNAFLPADVQNLVNHSDSKVLYTEKKSFEGMNFDEMPEVLAVIDNETMELLAARGEAKKAFEQVDELFAAAYPNGLTPDLVSFHHRGLDEVCAIMYTSGSTGNPKGVMLTVRNFSWNVERLYEAKMPYEPGESFTSILPYAHIFGLTCDLITPMCTGMHLVILGRMPIPSLVVEMMQTYKPKIFYAVPMVLVKMIEYTVGSEISSEDGKQKLENYTRYPEFCQMLREKIFAALGGRIQVFVTGGAAIAPAIEQLLAFQLNLPFITGYGMSECAPLLSLGHVGKYKAKSCGETMPTLEVRIASTDPAHVPGEFQVKGDCVFAGYYKNPEATAATYTEDGWFRTGDLGTLDEDSTLFLVGRCKHMLLSSNGQNIYPEEVEVLLNTMPYIQESVLVQRDHVLHALLVPNMTLLDNESLDAEALRAIIEGSIKNINTRLPQYSQVQSFELRFEPFAKTPKGSIRRFLYS